MSPVALPKLPIQERFHSTNNMKMESLQVKNSDGKRKTISQKPMMEVLRATKDMAMEYLHSMTVKILKTKR